MNVDVRSAELKFVTIFLDRAIYKSYFFISLYDNLSNISGFKFGEYRDIYFAFSRLFFDFSEICCALTPRNYNSRAIGDHAS